MNVNKTVLFLLAFFLLPLIAISGTIERYCFIDNFNHFYEFSGGKLGKKAFLVQAESGCGSDYLSGMATFAKTFNGYLITAFISRHAAAGVCNSYQLTLFIDENLLAATGNYDTLPRELAPDGAITLNRTACPAQLSAVPTLMPRPNFGPGWPEH